MYQILILLSMIACVLLVLIVLIQNPKGGGLSSNFSSSSQMMGVQKTGDFLEKGTWGLAIFLMVLALAINVAVKGGTDTGTSTTSKYNEQIKGASKAHGVAPAPTAPLGNGAAQPSTQQAAPLKPAGSK